MKTKIITSDELSNLKRIPINGREAKLYLIETLAKKELLKLFYSYGENIDKQKLNTLRALKHHRKTLSSIKELILPNKLVLLDKTERFGITLPYIKGDNLKTVLQNPIVPMSLKINFLKQLGTLLEKIKRMPFEVHLGDIHEENFLITYFGQLKAIDLDSMYFCDDITHSSKYFELSPIGEVNKYQKDRKKQILPSYNSDLFCYIIIILNTLTKGEVNYLNIEDFYNFLNYLSDLQIPKSFLDCASIIYTETDNKSPLPYLDELKRIKQKSYYQDYLKLTKKQ